MQMVDIHCHILPGVDDGAESIYDTLDMADLAYRSGTTQIVATPHCNITGVYENYADELYWNSFHSAQETIRREGIPVTLLPGMEVFAQENVPELIRSEKVVGINSTKNLLIEFDFTEEREFADSILEKVAATGMTPIIAHAERYRFVQENPAVVLSWMQKGFHIQVNKGSFWGRFGKGAEKAAYRLLNHNLVTAVASDAHSCVHRTPHMADVYSFLCEDYPKEYIKDLFYTNPDRLCHGQPPVQYQKIPFDEQP